MYMYYIIIILGLMPDKSNADITADGYHKFQVLFQNYLHYFGFILVIMRLQFQK